MLTKKTQKQQSMILESLSQPGGLGAPKQLNMVTFWDMGADEKPEILLCGLIIEAVDTFYCVTFNGSVFVRKFCLGQGLVATQSKLSWLQRRGVYC